MHLIASESWAIGRQRIIPQVGNQLGKQPSALVRANSGRELGIGGLDYDDTFGALLNVALALGDESATMIDNSDVHFLDLPYPQ